MLDLTTPARKGARLAVACGLTAALALGGVAAPVSTAYAAGSSTLTISKATSGNYKVYRLFSGTFSADSDGKIHLSDAQVNASYRSALIAALTATDAAYAPSIPSGATDAQATNAITDKIVALSADGRSQDFANNLARELASLTPTMQAEATGGTLSVDGMDDGYYLIMADTSDSSFSQEGNAMTSAILLPVNGDSSAVAKVSVPTVDKKVKDDNGVADGAFGGVADAGLIANGTSPAIDHLTYQITGTVPSNIDEFTYGRGSAHSYTYKFVDQLPEGLDVTADELSSWNVSIKVDGTDITGKFTPSIVQAGAATTITWATDDLRGVLKEAGVQNPAGAQIVLEYQPVYDAGDIERMFAAASTLTTPDVNTAKIEFSHSPYADGVGTTPEKETRVYDYNLKVVKVDDTGATLTGAAFTLTDADGKTVGRDITAADDGTFSFVGLDADVAYTLTETKVPTGMKSIDPITFTISATKNAEGTQVVSIGATETSDASNAATFTTSDATVTATVINVDGPDLPLTGQAGIIGGVAIGGIVVAVSAAALIRTRRKQA